METKVHNNNKQLPSNTASYEDILKFLPTEKLTPYHTTWQDSILLMGQPKTPPIKYKQKGKYIKFACQYYY